jgi:hypothetical protein
VAANLKFALRIGQRADVDRRAPDKTKQALLAPFLQDVVYGANGDLCCLSKVQGYGIFQLFCGLDDLERCAF